MAETALAARDTADNTLHVPAGCKPRQIKLARLLLECGNDPPASWAALIREAGYSDTTAEAAGRRTLQSVGVRRATEALRLQESDNKRGISALSARLLGRSVDDVKALEPRERIALGLKAAEVAAAIQEEPPAAADSKRITEWRLERRRRRYVRLGIRRAVVFLSESSHTTAADLLLQLLLNENEKRIPSDAVTVDVQPLENTNETLAESTALQRQQP